jgi:hypothetical protein
MVPRVSAVKTFPPDRAPVSAETDSPAGFPAETRLLDRQPMLTLSFNWTVKASAFSFLDCPFAASDSPVDSSPSLPYEVAWT